MLYKVVFSSGAFVNNPTVNRKHVSYLIYFIVGIKSIYKTGVNVFGCLWKHFLKMPRINNTWCFSPHTNCNMPSWLVWKFISLFDSGCITHVTLLSIGFYKLDPQLVSLKDILCTKYIWKLRGISQNINFLSFIAKLKNK